MPFETKYICDDCQPPYTFIKITDMDPRIGTCKTPSCPQCKERKASAKMHMKVRGDVKIETAEQSQERFDQEIKSGAKGPGIIGNNNFVKAVDRTAELVMQDYKMTDINMSSSLRDGDNCVPKLTHEQERKVDDVFSGKAKNNVMGMQGDKMTASLMKQVNAGAFRNYGDPVARQQENEVSKPKINIISHFDNRGKLN
jgi:hypothetical protein